MIQSFHWRDPDNLGDVVSTPTSYFDLGAVDYFHLNDTHLLKSKPVIVGGGGVLWANGTRDISQRNVLKIIWGAGVNRDNLKANDYCPDYISRFNLVGIRDWGLGYTWVPCPSCISPLFDVKYQVSNSVVAYLHGKIDNIGDIPAMSCLDKITLQSALQHIGSGETLITSSYHGMYWGILLNKRVIVVPHENSSRFYYSRYKPFICEDSNWKKFIGLEYDHSQALNQCRDANLKFYERVQCKLNAVIRLI